MDSDKRSAAYDSLRLEMIPERSNWRKEHPVPSYEVGSDATEYNDTQTEDLIKEARHLLGARSSDLIACTVAADLALEGRTYADGEAIKDPELWYDLSRGQGSLEPGSDAFRKDLLVEASQRSALVAQAEVVRSESRFLEVTARGPAEGGSVMPLDVSRSDVGGR